MQNEIRKIPGVDKLLNNSEIKLLAETYGLELITFCIRQVLQSIRNEVLAGGKVKFTVEIISDVKMQVLAIAERSLQPMINCTGIVLHTNLGRAPFNNEIIAEIANTLKGYSNLEFDLTTGKRGQRNDHITGILKYVTHAEDAVVVNNNAAALMLTLKTLCAGSEAIISRGELVEVGGSFRIPDIMAASGAKMIEVGATNRTRLSDYEKAITENTKVILKVHKSNYYIGGFTEEVENEELAVLAKKHNLIVIYDMGSGLLRKPKGLSLAQEPDVRSAIESEVDLVTFSGDKLLGGPQAGIIAGKKEFVQQIAKDPMMRALRVGKLTLTALGFVIKSYLKDDDLKKNIPLFMMLDRDKTELTSLAEKFCQLLAGEVETKIIASQAQIGGGTLPNLKIDSFGVQLICDDKKFAKQMFDKLLAQEKPILAILREGNIVFDMLTIFEEDMNYITTKISEIYRSENEDY